MGSRLGPAPAGDLAVDYRRVAAAYQQTLRYAADLRQLYQRTQRAVCQSLLGLANALEAKDPYTRGHSERVGEMSRTLALRVDLSAVEAEAIAQAGLLHDIGKIGVPEDVLRKPGPLDEREWEVMRRHPLVGAQIVAPFDFLGAGAIVIRHHHERMDGSGYPDGLAGETIPLGARIVAVADVWDAVTSDRPYRPALGFEAAVALLTSEAGRTLDAGVVGVFLEVIRERSRA